MYQTSHYGGLEYITRSAPSYASIIPTFYSIAATSSPLYNDGMFIPSRDAVSSYSAMGREKSCSSPYSTHQERYQFLTVQPEYHFVPQNFLKPGKEGIFVGQAEEVKEFVEEAFEKIFNQPFPNTIKMSILNHEEFRKIAPSPNTIGLSINRGQQGLLSEIFILNDTLGRVMLTIGHELGHVLTKSLVNPHDEEAKAYAFSLLWMKVIQKNNIANLGEAIVIERPAENGLHNISFSFVHRLLAQGKEAEEIYGQIIAQELSFSSQFFVQDIPTILYQ